jgi:class 3 adenylate cyclase/tetratricopeptide (TPR) repeat protein
MSTISRWLEEAGLGSYANAFTENGIDVDVLEHLSEDDLKDLGLNLGDRRRFQAALQSPAETRSPEPSRGDTSEAERRQLTVMFCDLVGSVALGEQLDLEEYRELLSRFRNEIVVAVGAFGGFVARHQGDGVLVYFGYPAAHENDAERAVSAGLQAIQRIRELEHPYSAELQVRAGIATGRAVVGDALSTGSVEELAAFGPTPNLAARLQGLAAPNTLLTSETTFRLTRSRFEFDPIANLEVKGQDRRVTAYRALGERTTSSAEELQLAATLPRMLGRGPEHELLAQRWRQACAGEGQLVLLCGEPGVGKSRLLQELGSSVRAEGANEVLMFCSAFQQNTALYPIRRQLNRPLGRGRAEDKRSTLRRMLMGLGADVLRHEPLLARLLSLTTEVEERESGLSVEQVRNRTLEALVDVILSIARGQPTLFLVEDLHWIDPTTQAFLSRLVDRMTASQLLIVLTFRPEFEPPWVRHPQATFLTLKYLGRADCEELVHQTAKDVSLPPDVVGDIINRTDGVPLFVEELTKAVVEAQDSTVSEGLEIPATLQDSLMARLDHLGTAKRVAQVASVIGREFSRELLAAVLGDEVELEESLTTLESSELVHRSASADPPMYRFKHALVQDIAYQSLLSQPRRAFHHQVAIALDPSGALAEFGDPATLAMHHEAAGNIDKAIDFHRQAGALATRAHALREAEHHFGLAAAQLRTLPETQDESARSAQTALDLGVVQMPLHGFGSKTVRRTYQEAYKLTSNLGDPARRFDAAWGLWLNHNVSGELDVAEDLIEEIDLLAEELSQPGYLLQAHHAGFTTLYITGDIEATQQRTDALLKLYSADEHRDHAFRYGGHDPAVCGHSHGALSGWLLGFADRSLELWSDGLKLAENLEHPTSIGIARNFGSMLFQLRRDPERVQQLSVVAPGTPLHFQSMSRALHGWAVAQAGDLQEGLRECRDGVEGYRSTGARARLSYLEYLLADLLYLAGQQEEALPEIEGAISNAVDKATLADLFRLKGDILLRHPGCSAEMAEKTLREALALAERQNAKAWRLRTSVSLARMYAGQERVELASQVLSPVYAEFREGLETPDLVEARVLLDELS